MDFITHFTNSLMAVVSGITVPDWVIIITLGTAFLTMVGSVFAVITAFRRTNPGIHLDNSQANENKVNADAIVLKTLEEVKTNYANNLLAYTSLRTEFEEYKRSTTEKFQRQEEYSTYLFRGIRKLMKHDPKLASIWAPKSIEEFSPE